MCEYCYKPIVAIKSKRKNGGNGNDWDTRKYHIKCWKSLKDLEAFKISQELWVKKQGDRLERAIC